MCDVKPAGYLKARLAALCLGAALGCFAPLSAAGAQGERDIPAPQSEAGQNGGDFPPAPAAYGQSAADGQSLPSGQNDSGGQSGADGQSLPSGQNDSGGQSGAEGQSAGALPPAGGAALWPSVAARREEPSGQNSAAAPMPQPGQAASAGDGQQTLRDLQAQVQNLQSRLDNLEAQMRQSSHASAAAAQPALMQPKPLPAAEKAKADDEQNYAAPANISADALYAQGEDFMAQGYYAKAALVWRAFAARFGQDARAARAGYNFGECYYARALYGQAAEAYLNVRNHYKDADIAPQNLLRLAQSVAGLGDSQTACAALDSLQHEYPRALAGVSAQAAELSGSLQCP